MIVLWNTIYMEAALTKLRAEGFEVKDEDAAKLSPLLDEHINMLVLLCHKLSLIRKQQGQRCSCVAIALAMRARSVVMESGT